MNIKTAPYTYTPASGAYTDYMTAKAPLDFSHVWKNQEADVHPPLYYYLIYMISYLFKGSDSKWIAGGLNIFFMLLTLWISRKMMKEFACSKAFSNVFTGFFILSSGILSTITFFRMYILLMFEVTLLTYLLVKYRKKGNNRFYIGLTVLTIAGALTHYYFFIYQCFVLCDFYGGKALERSIKVCDKYVHCRNGKSEYFSCNVVTYVWRDK